VPGALEGEQLRIGGVAGFVAEDDVVVAVRVEGRVEVDQVDRGVGQVATQDVEVDVGLHRARAHGLTDLVALDKQRLRRF
jgi:hypothetical protein